MPRGSGAQPDALMRTTDAMKHATAKPGVCAPEVVLTAEHILAGAYDDADPGLQAKRARVAELVRDRCPDAELMLDALGLIESEAKGTTP